MESKEISETEFPVIPVKEGIELRMRKPEEARDVFDLVEKNRAYLGKWLPWVEKTKEPAKSKEYLEDCIKNFKERKMVDLGIYQDKKLIGSIGINGIDKNKRTADIGYWIDESHAGKKIMSAAVTSMIKYAFTELGLEEVTIHCAQGNDPSAAIPQKLGFTDEGLLSEKDTLNGESVFVRKFSLAREKWERENQNEPKV